MALPCWMGFDMRTTSRRGAVDARSFGLVRCSAYAARSNRVPRYSVGRVATIVMNSDLAALSDCKIAGS